MAKLKRNALLFAKLETVYGTDPTPTALANAILCRAITPQPISAEYAERTLIRPFFGSNGSLPAAVHAECEFEVELAGSGAAGTAPKWAPLLRACGFAETLTASTSAVYAPVTNGAESATLWYHLDGILHKINGARGTVAFELNAKGIPVMRFRFVGKYSTPSDALMPSNVDYSGFTTPVVVNHTNTTAFTVHGVSCKMQSYSVDVANQVTYRELVGFQGVVFTDRAPAGSVSFELDTVAAKDWWTAVKNAIVAPTSITHGTVAGNIVKLDGPKVQLTQPQYAESDGIAMLNLNLAYQPNTGNDELVVTCQ
ncbi:phage tail tube protein [Noviherbaspirillum malthae]|uniref:phage tail tube protein n=1 Tax=Noviherbaspirillum malthae TaxID=1260987 RepID=UPI00188E0A1D|nr:phage tail tube protein [Noviherbaspirillum malthae]